MDKADIIIINPHYCSREEYQELIDYLDSKCWCYKVENKTRRFNNELY